MENCTKPESVEWEARAVADAICFAEIERDDYYFDGMLAQR